MSKVQLYEEYWSTTLANTDIHGTIFIGQLKIIVDFIDKKNLINVEYTEDLYKKLQEKINEEFPKHEISIRKAINQYVKLGFIKYHLNGYHHDVHRYLRVGKQEQKNIFSKILYEESRFNASVTNDDTNNQIKFLIRTILNVGKITKEELAALMRVENVDEFPNGFTSRKKIDDLVKRNNLDDFEERKYNQLQHLISMLKAFTDIFVSKDSNIISVKENDIKIHIEETKKRDPYLHRIYKQGLKNESVILFEKEICYVEKIAYPYLIASHIKPYKSSEKEEEYDSDNGILLSPTLDSLFDKGKISFDENGKIMLSKSLNSDVIDKLKYLNLDKKALSNENRAKYLNYHREWIFEKNTKKT